MSEEFEVKGYRIRKDLMYTLDDEWVKIEGDIAIIGVTDYAQKKLKNIISIELPEIGRRMSKREVVATIESVKAVADVYSPLTGTVIEINETLKDQPELINHDPYGKGWIIKIKIENPSEINMLLKPEEYAKKIYETE
ncbi:MAG: glycine cleavage system protein GcvH [Desulfurococcales archaeon]|nr:glycine cleavage system protein GcvH [Desulfurococcales archaeon]NAZ13043.1 glycine cleavage system protein GcvH [Desulfurococcales archaeon]